MKTNTSITSGTAQSGTPTIFLLRAGFADNFTCIPDQVEAIVNESGRTSIFVQNIAEFSVNGSTPEDVAVTIQSVTGRPFLYLHSSAAGVSGKRVWMSLAHLVGVGHAHGALKLYRPNGNYIGIPGAKIETLEEALRLAGISLVYVEPPSTTRAEARFIGATTANAEVIRPRSGMFQRVS